MASEKMIAMLRAKGAPYTPEEMARMEDSEGWNWIYSQTPKKQKPKDREVCFTGFTLEEKNMLVGVATQSGFVCKDSVTKSLEILVTGETPGPSKIKKAEAQGCVVMDAVAFLDFLKCQQEQGEGHGN